MNQTLQQLSADWEQLKGSLPNAPAASLTQLAVTSRNLTDPAAVAAMLSTWNGDGWVETTETVGTLDEWREERGPAHVLNAELCDGAHSIHIRHAGAHWIIGEYHEGSGEDTYLKVSKTFMGAEGTPGSLRYHLFYTLTDGRAREVHARFCGFEGDGHDR